MPRDEVEAAYFTLLRAREELSALRRWEEYLGDEQRRLRRFVNEGDAHADTVDRRLQRALRHTDGPLKEAIDARIATIRDEQSRMPERIEAAQRFVDECERDHAALRGGR